MVFANPHLLNAENINVDVSIGQTYTSVTNFWYFHFSKCIYQCSNSVKKLDLK